MTESKYKELYSKLNEALETKRKFYNLEDYHNEALAHRLCIFRYVSNNEYVNDFYNEYKTKWINKHPQFEKYINKDLFDIYEILVNEKPFIKDIKTFANKLFINFSHDEQNEILNNPDEVYDNMETLSLNGWYESYEEGWYEQHNVERKDSRKFKSLLPEILPYPFKTKSLKGQEYVVNKTIPDYRINKKLMKPTYATHPYSYEIDIMFVQHPQFQKRYLKQYLVCINVNTRYLFMFPIQDKTEKSIIKALKQLLSQTKVTYIKCDGERGFNSKAITDFFKTNNIKTFISDSKYTYKLKIVDRVIRTIRDAMGLDPYWLANENLMSQLVNYYNNTKHVSLKLRDPTFNKKWNYYTPAEMQNNIDLEWSYIRKMDRKYLKVINEINKYCDYKPGNVLLIHLNLSKTSAKHEKQRRKFSNLAIFKEFKNGNAIVDLLRPYSFMKSYIEIPLMNTRYLCENVDKIPDNYIKYFLLNE